MLYFTAFFPFFTIHDGMFSLRVQKDFFMLLLKLFSLKESYFLPPLSPPVLHRRQSVKGIKKKYTNIFKGNIYQELKYYTYILHYLNK